MRHITNGKIWMVLVAFACTPNLSTANEAPPTNRIPIEKAREMAIATYHGKILGEELEFEYGHWIYSFDLKSKGDKNVHEVHVDALNGKILDVHVETAADEKKELLEDAKESSNN